MNKYYILDTETTGLGNDDEIVEIAIIDNEGNIILNELIYPNKKIPEVATSIHGITNKMVEDSLYILNILPVLKKLEGETIYIYNKDFDIRMLKQSLNKWGRNLNENNYDFRCAMLQYAENYGEWNEYYGNYKWVKLTTAYKNLPQKNKNIVGSHRALQDCLMTLEVIKFLNQE